MEYLQTILPAFLISLFLLGHLSVSESMAQSRKGDEIIGIWLVQDKDAHVRIYRATNGKYYGKVHWLEEQYDNEGNPRTDVNNPDESLRNTPIMGKVIMKDFIYDEEEKEWVEGTVYQSDTGKTYTGYMKMNPDGTLYMRGFVLGMRFLGKSNVWTRVK